MYLLVIIILIVTRYKFLAVRPGVEMQPKS